MELLMTRVSGQETTPETLEIETLVQRTLDGDCRAFEQIVLRYERRVMMLSARLLHGLDEAQDATQEVFLRALKYLHRLDVRRPIDPWLMRISVNVCRDSQLAIRGRHSPCTESSTQTHPPRDPRHHSQGLTCEQQSES